MLSNERLEGNNISFGSYIAKVYLWMFIGVLCTAITAFVMVETSVIWIVYDYTWIPFALLIAKVILVSYLSSRIYDMSIARVKGIFIGYSILTGVTFAALGLCFGTTSVFMAFGFASILFACLSIIGLTTQKDYSSLRGLLFVGIIILCVISGIGMFFDLSAFDLAIGIIGTIIFLGITIYDTQKMKQAFLVEGNTEVLERQSIYFALSLYLDFINILIYLIRILGRQSRD